MTYHIVGLLRIRNESLILPDTLDHLACFVDGIVVFDDASNDKSAAIVQKHPKVLDIVQNKKWQRDRAKEETRHRQILLTAGKKYNPEWFFYVDADERFEGNIRQFLLSPKSHDVAGIRIRLLDAYLTKNDKQPYRQGKLMNFRTFFGPEMREILMIFRNQNHARFEGLDAREPQINGKIVTKFWCQHYGKSLSVKHWEETCDYYANHFSKYGNKWKARKGKAIHKKSDFNRPLYTWSKAKENAISIYQYKNMGSRYMRFGYRFRKKLSSFFE